jgi:hypothetical protein
MNKWGFKSWPTLVLINKRGKMISKTCKDDIELGWEAFEKWKKAVVMIK